MKQVRLAAELLHTATWWLGARPESRAQSDALNVRDRSAHTAPRSLWDKLFELARRLCARHTWCTPDTKQGSLSIESSRAVVSEMCVEGFRSRFAKRRHLKNCVDAHAGMSAMSNPKSHPVHYSLDLASPPAR